MVKIMSKFATTFVLLLSFCSLSTAQVKIEGPKEATVGYRAKAKVILGDATDVKVRCIPANDDWMLIQDWEGNKFIDFVPGKKAVLGSYTFIIAANKENKTFLETWETVVKQDSPLPPEPGPTPEPTDIRNTELYGKLLASYQVFPDEAAKAKLISAYEQFANFVDQDKFANFKEAEQYLASATPQVMGSSLKQVRDTVADYLATNVGRQATAWDKSKLLKAMNNVTLCLKALP